MFNGYLVAFCDPLGTGAVDYELAFLPVMTLSFTFPFICIMEAHEIILCQLGRGGVTRWATCNTQTNKQSIPFSSIAINGGPSILCQLGRVGETRWAACKIKMKWKIKFRTLHDHPYQNKHVSLFKNIVSILWYCIYPLKNPSK